MLRTTLLGLAMLCVLPAQGQTPPPTPGATVEVNDSLYSAQYVAWLLAGGARGDGGGLNGISSGDLAAADYTGSGVDSAPTDGGDAPPPFVCSHSRVRYQPSGFIGANWLNAHDGAQLFYYRFTNSLPVAQKFTRTVEGTVTSSFDGSITLSAACAKVGVTVEVKVQETFPRKT